MDRFFTKAKNYSGVRRSDSDQITKISDIDPNNECHRESLANFLVSLRFSPDPVKGRKKCQEIYKTILNLKDGDVHQTNLFFYKLLTDGEAASYFYGHVDNDLGSKWEERYKAWCISDLNCLASCQSLEDVYLRHILRPFANWLRVIASTAMYYFDIIKDVYLVSVLASVQEKIDDYNERESMSRKVIIFLCISSLLATDVAKIFLVMSSGALSAKMRCWGTIFVPFLPAFLYHRDWRFRALRRETIDGLENNWAHAFRDHLMMLAAPLEIAPDTDMILTWTRTKLRESSVIKAELRATENFLEHYVQLTILSTLTWIYFDHKDDDYTNLSAVIIGDNKNLIILSAIISFISLLRGQVNLVATLKRAGPKAMALLILYFALGTPARVVAVVMFIMPMLHGSVEKVRTATAIQNYSFFVGLVVCHLLVSFLLLTWFYGGAQSKRRRFLQSSWTLICPPLFIDWETLHRLNSYKMPIEECWKRSRILFLSHNLLMVTENMAMCLASVLVRDWKWGSLRFICMIFFPLIQICMIALAYLYFTQGHLWSRILQRYPMQWRTRISERPLRANRTSTPNGLVLDIVPKTQVEEEM